MTTNRQARHTGVAAQLLVVLLLVLAAACGGGDGETSANGDDDSAASTAAPDAGSEAAGEWQPEEPITMVAPAGPGGGGDIMARAMAAGLEEVRPGITVTVENREGGSTAIGYTYVYEQEGSPYTLLASETLGVMVPLTQSVAYHWEDFTPIMQMAEDAGMLTVGADSEWASLDDFLAAARSGEVLVGLPAATGLEALIVELLEEEIGEDISTVVFEGGGEQLRGLLSGDVNAGIMNPGEIASQVEAGGVVPLTLFSSERFSEGLFADVPTATESGVDISLGQFRGMLAPGGIDEAARQYYIDAMRDWTETESYQAYISDNSLIPVQRFGDDFVSFLSEYEDTIESALTSME